LTFRLLSGGVEFPPEILARGILERSLVLAKLLLCIRVALGNDLTVADMAQNT